MGISIRFLPFALFLAAALPSLAGEPPAAPSSSPTRPLHLIYTVNSFGSTEPMGCPHKILHNGGLARRFNCIRSVAAAQQPVVVLDGGAALFPEVDKAPDGDRDKLLLKAELIVEAYNRMGYKAMAVGTNDLLLGLPELIHLAGRARFPFLCANLETPAGRPFKPHAVIEAGGLRVGVIGLITDTLGSVYLERNVPGGKLLDPLGETRKAVAELSGKADIIVALSHLRMDANRKLAREVPGIDIVIDPSIEFGNHHPHIRDEDWEEPVGSTLILRGEGNGAALGVAEIGFGKAGIGMGSKNRLDFLAGQLKEGTIDDEGRKELAAIPGRNSLFLRKLSLAPHYLDDPEGAALVDAHRKGEDPAAVPARPAPALREAYKGAEDCLECHEKQYRKWDGTRHSRAMASIAGSEYARRPECLACHVTGYGLAFNDPAEAKKFGGVQCEACHGTNPDHRKDPAKYRFQTIAESTCLPCHNEDVVPANFSYGMALQKVKCPLGTEPAAK